ncbi:hypothetical protein MHYP_G00048850 [Metynnis hypsauchen]
MNTGTSRRSLARRRPRFCCPTGNSAKETVELLLQHVIRVHGMPSDLVSDQGPQFTSRFWKAFCRLMGASVSLSSASTQSSMAKPTGSPAYTVRRHLDSHHIWCPVLGGLGRLRAGGVVMDSSVPYSGPRSCQGVLAGMGWWPGDFWGCP